MAEDWLGQARASHSFDCAITIFRAEGSGAWAWESLTGTDRPLLSTWPASIASLIGCRPGAWVMDWRVGGYVED